MTEKLRTNSSFVNRKIAARKGETQSKSDLEDSELTKKLFQKSSRTSQNTPIKPTNPQMSKINQDYVTT